MKWPCRFGWHNWGRWQMVDEGKLQGAGTIWITGQRWTDIGRYREESRQCAECGKSQLRTITTRL